MSSLPSDMPRSQRLVRTVLRAVCRRWPLWAGQSRITRSSLARFGYRGIQSPHRVTNALFTPISQVDAKTLRGPTELHPVPQIDLASGLWLFADLTDYNARMLDLFGTPDPKVVALCRALLQPGDCFLDIGANIGAVGLLCSDVVQPGGKVEMFEPQPALHARLEQAIDQQGIGHVRAHAMALLDRDGVLPLTVPRWHTGQASLATESSHTSSDHVVSIDVEVADARRVLPPLTAGRYWAAKIDAEGSDAAIFCAIAGEPGLRFCLFEFNDPSDWPRVRDCADQYQLALLEVVPSWWRLTLRHCDKAGPSRGVHDLLAFPAAVIESLPTTCSLKQLTRALANWQKAH